MWAAQQRLIRKTFGVLSCAIVFCTMVFCTGLVCGPSAAQGLFPEVLRAGPELPHRPPGALPALPANTGATASVLTTSGSSSPLVRSPELTLPLPVAPMPDLNVHVPADTTRSLRFGPMFSRLTGAYRGETFNSGSTTDPGLRDQRFPISGFALKVPLN